MNPVRLGIILVIIGTVLIIGAIGIFVFFFYSHDFSTNVSDWGAFGSYLGGVLGVSISILALTGAVIAIYQQHRTDQRVNNHTIASDLTRSIERLEDSIDSSLQELTVGVHYPDRDVHIDTDAFRILTEIHLKEVVERIIPKYSDDPSVIVNAIMNKDYSEEEKFEKIRLYELFATTCGKLKFMRSMLTKHKVLSGHNAATIYYRTKYKLAVERLRQAGYPLETWGNIDDISQLKELGSDTSFL